MKIRLIFKFLGITLVGGFITIGVYALGVNFNWYGELEGKGQIITDSYPERLLEEKKRAQTKVNPHTKQILFGDTHVHSTYSTDAFLWSLPILNGEGPHPISDACDYARFCSALDFWVTTDHAEASAPSLPGDAVVCARGVPGAPAPAAARGRPPHRRRPAHGQRRGRAGGAKRARRGRRSARRRRRP